MNERKGWGPDDGPDPLDQDATAPPPPPPHASMAGDGRDRNLHVPATDPRWKVRRWIVLGAGVAGAVAFQVSMGLQDTALFFIGIPALLTALIILGGPARSAMGRMFAATTMGLLLTAMYLGEAALCVAFVAPLVWGVGAVIVSVITRAVDRAARQRRMAFVGPLLLLASLEGSVYGDPIDTIVITRTVDGPVDGVAAALAAGPAAGVAPQPLLLRTPMMQPATITGSGLAVGDTWTFAYDEQATMASVFTVVQSRPGTLVFDAVRDDAPTTRSFAWRSATVEWEARGEQTAVTMTFEVQRALTPSWWFGPVTQAFLADAGEHLLDTMGLTPAAQR